MTVEHAETNLAAPRAAAPSLYRGDAPPPFLSQLRALSALRHQLDAIEAALEPELERRRLGDPDSTFEMHVIPNRLIARLGTAGLSFSWIGGEGGQSATVAAGRLLVIQWAGVETETRGAAALRSARPVRECVYRPDGTDPAHWRWQIDGDDSGEPATFTTDALVADWLTASSLPRPV